MRWRSLKTPACRPARRASSTSRKFSSASATCASTVRQARTVLLGRRLLREATASSQTLALPGVTSGSRKADLMPRLLQASRSRAGKSPTRNVRGDLPLAPASADTLPDPVKGVLPGQYAPALDAAQQASRQRHREVYSRFTRV